jgi:hypothetical protein
VRARRKTLVVGLAFLLSIALGFGLVLRHPAVAPRIPAGWGLGRSASRSVLVIVLCDREAVAEIRALVGSERVVAAAENAFALVEKRIISASFEGVGPLLVRAGWRDLPLEIVVSGKSARKPESRPVSRVAELLRKPTLTAVEASLLLSLL